MERNFQNPLPESLKGSTQVFKGVRFDVNALELPGKFGSRVRREVVIHPGAVVMLPILDDQNIIMIRNERFAVGETLWELPAGTLEPHEPPEETAKRELIEETGYRCERLDHLTTFYTTPGFCNESMYAYVAKGLTSVGQDLDESEKIVVEIVSWERVIQMIKEQIICDGKTLTALLYYHVFY